MWIKRVLGAMCVVLGTSVEAHAQGCCAFGSSLTPTRLDLHERVLVGLQSGISWLHGSHTPNARYRGAPEGTTDVELREILFATAAIGSRVQASVLVPWVATYRDATSSAGEWGHGLGDISGLVRADVVQLHEYPDVPSVALLLGGTFPTGTPAEAATSTLGTDTTGSGVYRGVVGASLEQTFGSWLTNVTGTIAIAAPVTRAGVETYHAPRLSFMASAGYAWTHHLSAAGAVLFETEGATEIDDVAAANSNKRRTELALITTYSFVDSWRAQFRLSGEPPLSVFGVNEPARLGGTVAIIWSAL